MNGSFRAATLEDLPQLSCLLTQAFGGQPETGILHPDVVAWKYWEQRPDWAGARNYVIEKAGRIVAHAGIWPVTFLHQGTPVVGIQMIDWAAARDSPGAGLALVRKLTGLFDFIYSIGGSDAARRALPAFGFVTITHAWTAARPLRPLRQILTHQA